MRLGVVAAAGAAVLSVLASGGASSPAHAERTTVSDGTGDVWGMSGDDGFVAAGSVANTDLTSVALGHGERSVKVKASFTALEPGTSSRVELVLLLRTRSGDQYLLDVRTDRRLDGARVTLDLHDRAVDCPGARAVVDPSRARVSVRVPRRCLGLPDRLRFQAWVTSYLASGDVVYRDDALSPNMNSHRWSAAVSAD